MNRESNLSDSELLRAMSAGEEDAFVTLYRRRQGSVYRFALQMIGCRSLAEDVTQEVFIVLMNNPQMFDPARGSVSSFLLGIARNLVLRRLQRDRLFVSLGDGDEIEQPAMAGEPAELLARSETIESVRRAVLSLPPRYREVVVLCDLQEISYVEAAAILHCAVGTVRSRLHRARALLMEKLGPAEETESETAAVRTARCFA
jgi:RNA polymerase sigma-70 factor (ECF subfamily)